MVKHKTIKQFFYKINTSKKWGFLDFFFIQVNRMTEIMCEAKGQILFDRLVRRRSVNIYSINNPLL